MIGSGGKWLRQFLSSARSAPRRCVPPQQRTTPLWCGRALDDGQQRAHGQHLDCLVGGHTDPPHPKNQDARPGCAAVAAARANATDPPPRHAGAQSPLSARTHPAQLGAAAPLRPAGAPSTPPAPARHGRCTPLPTHRRPTYLTGCQTTARSRGRTRRGAWQRAPPRAAIGCQRRPRHGRVGGGGGACRRQPPRWPRRSGARPAPRRGYCRPHDAARASTAGCQTAAAGRAGRPPRRPRRRAGATGRTGATRARSPEAGRRSAPPPHAPSLATRRGAPRRRRARWSRG